MPTQYFQRGFTLVELIVVIAIIALLSTVGVSSYSRVLDQGKMTKMLTQIKDIEKAARLFNIQTSKWPIDYNGISGTNEFLTSNSVTNWSGPYIESWPATHPWGGAVKWLNYDPNSDGIVDRVLFLDDDQPGTGYANDQGWISQTAMQEIDKRLDDGNLSTGNIRGNGGFSSAPHGELVIILK